jgi:von Willebrand factor A domain-containing protein 8
MAQKALSERLKEIGMTQHQLDDYLQFRSAVAQQIDQLRNIIQSLQTRGKERTWIRHRTSGDLDDAKLIDALSGDRYELHQRVVCIG